MLLMELINRLESTDGTRVMAFEGCNAGSRDYVAGQVLERVEAFSNGLGLTAFNAS